MPKPMVCLSVAWCQFAEGFRPYFSERQWKYFVIVLLGLVECKGRRTLRGLLSTVGESVSGCGLSIDEAPPDRFGSALATGDFNRDGFSDLAIGAPKIDLGTISDAGTVSVIYGSGQGLHASLQRADQVFSQQGAVAG
jgi:hypothetical protein